MNNVIKKTMFLTVFINVLLSVFANGTQDGDRQTFGSIQLKIVNLTNNKINFYFNTLYGPREIKSQEEYITMKTLASYSRTLLDTVIPSFIGIQYSNDENIIIYSFFRIMGELRFLENNQYIVVVKDSSINFIEGNIDDTYCGKII
jgi:hypothetical protein